MLYLGHLKPSKTLFLVLKNQVFGGENLCCLWFWVLQVQGSLTLEHLRTFQVIQQNHLSPFHGFCSNHWKNLLKHPTNSRKPWKKTINPRKKNKKTTTLSLYIIYIYITIYIYISILQTTLFYHQKKKKKTPPTFPFAPSFPTRLTGTSCTSAGAGGA